MNMKPTLLFLSLMISLSAQAATLTTNSFDPTQFSSDANTIRIKGTPLLTNVSASSLTGILPDARLSTNVARLNIQDNFLTNITVTLANIGTTVVPGLTLSNSTLATTNAQQNSAALRFPFSGFKTAATAGAQPGYFDMYAAGVQGSVNPSGVLNIGSSINGGALNSIISLASGGLVTVLGNFQVNGTSSLTGGDVNTSGRMISGTGWSFNVDNGFVFQGNQPTTTEIKIKGNAGQVVPIVQVLDANNLVLINITSNGVFSAAATIAATNGFFYPQGTNTAPTAAFIGGAVGSVTNHLMKCVVGGLIDYWSDGTTLWSKQLAP